MATKMHPKVDVRKTKPKVCKQMGPNNVFWEPFGCHLGAKGCQNSIKMQPNGALRVPKVDHWKMLRKRDAFPAICRTILGAIFHQKCIPKSIQKSMSKKYGNLHENASKMMPKRGPKSMTNLWNFGTCDFLFLAKGVTLKSFFYMIRGTKNKPEAINNRCQKEVRKNDAKRTEKWAKREPKMIPNRGIWC